MNNLPNWSLGALKFLLSTEQAVKPPALALAEEEEERRRELAKGRELSIGILYVGVLHPTCAYVSVLEQKWHGLRQTMAHRFRRLGQVTDVMHKASVLSRHES